MTVGVAMAVAVAFAKSKDVTSVEITPPAAAGLCPGEHFPLELSATDASGKARVIKLGKKDDFTVEWELGEAEGQAEVVMPLDPREAWGKEGLLTVTSITNPSVRAEVLLPLRFDCSVVVDLSGAPGDPGSKGEDGNDVPDGNGTPGSAGETGQSGKDAPEVHVRVSQVTEPRSGEPVLQAEIEVLGEGVRSYAAFSPTAGELVVLANGGRGGQGGTGGAGGNGQPGMKGVGGGVSGAGGDGGIGGPGGRGGVVVFFVDPSAEGRLKGIIVEKSGGPGGSPGLGGGLGDGGWAGSTRPGSPGTEGRPGPSGPDPELQSAVVGPLW